MKRHKLLLFSLLLLVTVSSCVGCSTLGYYSQSVRGHLGLMSQREPISEVLTDKSLDGKTRQNLQTAVEVRNFASEQLALPENDSYRKFVQLDREYVVWNVVAAPEFSLKPKEWCFPVAGCVSYRGYYQLEDANAFATEQKKAGLDVAVIPVPAYSTLGWFDDPVLSSMFNRGELILAETIFHELAHQQLYVQDDSVFNEAFASSVGEAGVDRWLQASKREQDLQVYRQHLLRKAEFISLLRRTAKRLNGLYEQKLAVAEMRSQKAALFERLQQEYAELRQQWGGYSGYDRWFERELNNARLASIAVYRDRVPDFVRWLASCDGDLRRYYAMMEKLGKLDKALRHEKLTGPARCAG